MARSNNLNAPITNPDRSHRLHCIAFWSCIISFIFDILLGLAVFINCIRTESFISSFYAVHVLMDSLCTSFVAWHLKATTINGMCQRDRVACCVIGALYIGSFLAIETRAIQGMIFSPNERPDLIVVICSLIYILIFTILSIIKLRISSQIKSMALKFDALNSIIGMIMVLPFLTWERLGFINKFTHLDDLVQILMALFLFVAGGKLILDSIPKMNEDYERKVRERRLRQMLKETDDHTPERSTITASIIGT